MRHAIEKRKLPGKEFMCGLVRRVHLLSQPIHLMLLLVGFMLRVGGLIRAPLYRAPPVGRIGPATNMLLLRTDGFAAFFQLVQRKIAHIGLPLTQERAPQRFRQHRFRSLLRLYIVSAILQAAEAMLSETLR